VSFRVLKDNHSDVSGTICVILSLTHFISLFVNYLLVYQINIKAGLNDDLLMTWWKPDDNIALDDTFITIILKFSWKDFK